VRIVTKQADGKKQNDLKLRTRLSRLEEQCTPDRRNTFCGKKVVKLTGQQWTCFPWADIPLDHAKNATEVITREKQKTTPQSVIAMKLKIKITRSRN